MSVRDEKWLWLERGAILLHVDWLQTHSIRYTPSDTLWLQILSLWGCSWVLSRRSVRDEKWLWLEWGLDF